MTHLTSPKSLRRPAEQQHRGVRQSSIVQQTQMLQQLLGRRPFRERELAGLVSRTDELCHPFDIEVVQIASKHGAASNGPPRISFFPSRNSTNAA